MREEEAVRTATLYSLGQVAASDRTIEDLEVGEMENSE